MKFDPNKLNAKTGAVALLLIFAGIVGCVALLELLSPGKEQEDAETLARTSITSTSDGRERTRSEVYRIHITAFDKNLAKLDSIAQKPEMKRFANDLAQLRSLAVDTFTAYRPKYEAYVNSGRNEPVNNAQWAIVETSEILWNVASVLSTLTNQSEASLRTVVQRFIARSEKSSELTSRICEAYAGDVNAISAYGVDPLRMRQRVAEARGARRRAAELLRDGETARSLIAVRYAELLDARVDADLALYNAEVFSKSVPGRQ